MRLKGYIGEATAYDKKLMLERRDATSWLKSLSAWAEIVVLYEYAKELTA